jgi:3-isopropylmalate dehydrogenase
MTIYWVYGGRDVTGTAVRVEDGVRAAERGGVSTRDLGGTDSTAGSLSAISES